jgi:Response regulator containing CheY-like receiver, AAA-type ATPase, and DNA-binding domains
MQEIEELIEAMAPSDANVLIAGESGVGKEVIAMLFTPAAGVLDNRW